MHHLTDWDWISIYVAGFFVYLVIRDGVSDSVIRKLEARGVVPPKPKKPWTWRQALAFFFPPEERMSWDKVPALMVVLGLVLSIAAAAVVWRAH